MSKHIKVSLSVASIDELIKKVNNLQNIVNKAKMEAIEEIMEGAYEVVLQNTPFDTGESQSSTTYTITPTKATLKQSGTHVIYNEFGTGIVGAKNPYPDSNKRWAYSQEGWIFYQTNPSSRYYGGKHYTLGQIAHAQMYKGSLYIRENISKAIKRKVSGALSKI